MTLLFLLAVAILHISGTLANPCVSDCDMGHLGNYQSCNGCNVYVSCFFGYTIDNRPCPGNLVWDDNKKRCEWTSDTCPPKTTTTTTTTTTPAPDCSTKYAFTVSSRLKEFYVDGKPIASALNHSHSQYWQYLGQGCIPGAASVIAMSGYAFGGDPGGFLLSTSTGFMTNGSEAWRCAENAENGWMETNFDDSHWSLAHENGKMGEMPGNLWMDIVHPEVNPDAKYIWTYPRTVHAYCRGHFPTK